ncbi:MAG: ATP-dependent helicase [Pseudomonadaceae bacterium]|nr:ATP-dependent helicase [Pseudomonadaceae bacterium]
MFEYPMHPTLNPQQTAAVAYTGSQLLLGAAGSGKTAVLVEKAASLIAAGMPAHDIAVTTFAARTIQALRLKLAGRVGQQAPRLKVETLLELARAQLAAAGQQLDFASNNRMREIIREVMAEAGFAGTLGEAEELLHRYKSLAKKVEDDAPHITLYHAYKQRLEDLRLHDRNDILRRHVLGMQSGTVAPVPVSHLLVDNLQDATELQLAWLKHHLAAGKTLVMAGNDDLTAYTPNGAQGAQGLHAVAEWDGVTKTVFTDTYRIPATLDAPLEAVAAKLEHRIAKPHIPHNGYAATLTVQGFAAAADEHVFLLAKARELAGAAAQSVGVVTRTDYHANLLTHLLRKQGFNPASYARLIWEDPAAQQVLALLYVLLNASSTEQLLTVFAAFGTDAATCARLHQGGLSAENWLPRQAPLPHVADVPATQHAAIATTHRLLVGAWQVLQAKTLAPREVFKGLLEDLLAHQPEDTHPTMLLAADMLLSLSGKLADILPRVVAETMPDMSAPLVVAPVREVRNLEFTTLIMPHAHADHWPRPASGAVPADADHERHLFYLALSRTRGDILITHHAGLSHLVEELQGYL